MAGSLAGRALGPEWRVAEHVPGQRLVLEKDGAAASKRARGALVVSLGSLAAGVALVSITPPSLGLVAWPVAALFFAVAALGLPSMLRSVRQRLAGVQLEATREPPRVRGWPVATGLVADVRARPEQLEAGAVEAVSLQLVDHPPLTLALLEVVLRDGRRLAGPEVATEKGAPTPLRPVADELAALLRVELRSR